MSKSKYEYVRSFEEQVKCLPNSWIVVRINGRNFQRFSEMHGFEQPNDKRAIELMTRAASSVMEELKEVTLAYGASDEYSFVFRKDAQLYNRRHDKILSTVCSLFSTSFVYYWNQLFPFTKMIHPPSFDGRIILYPTDKNLRDYLSWRQADTHFTNLYNTTFWGLVLKKKYLFHQAEERIKHLSVSSKIELLQNELEINYNGEPPLFRKGTTLIRKLVPTPDGSLREFVFPLTVDIIGEPFWKENPEIIGMKSIQICNKKEGAMGFLVPNNLPIPHPNGDMEPLPPPKPGILGPGLPPPPPPQMPLGDRPMKMVKPNSILDRRIRRNILDRPGPLDRRISPALDPELRALAQREAQMLDLDVPMPDSNFRDSRIDGNLRDSRPESSFGGVFERLFPDRRPLHLGDRSHSPLKPRDYPIFSRRNSGPVPFSR